MRTHLTRALTALATAAALVAVPACRHGEEATTTKVWGIDVEPLSLVRKTIQLDGDQLTVRLTVIATTCQPEAFQSAGGRGGGYGHDCDLEPKLEEVEQSLRTWELAAKARLTVVVEDGSQVIHTFLPRDVRLAMGSRSHRDPLHWTLPSVPTADSDYRVYAKFTDCSLTNGSACANNSRRFDVWQSSQIAGSQSALTVPEKTGSLVRQELRTAAPGSGERVNPSGQDAPLAGVALRRNVFGSFRLGAGPAGVSFWGAEFAEPQPPEAVDRNGSTIIQKAWERTGVPVGGAAAPVGEMRRHDSGPQGGQVWCQTYKYQVLKNTTFYLCGWVDQWTVGAVLVNDFAVEKLNLTEARAAALLVSMRKDIEKAS